MKVLKWLDNYLEEALLLVMLCAMTCIMGVQITARYVFSSSLSWSEEITRFMFIISGFVSASFCIKKSVFFAYLIPFAWNYMMAQVESGQLSPACGIQMWTIQSSAVISFVLCVFRLIQKWIERLGMIMGKEEC